MKKLLIILTAAFMLFSCGKDESSLTSSNSITVQTSDTWVKLSVIDTQGLAKPGLTVMMFSSPVSNHNNLPPILKQVVSDSSGLAFFDLNNFITSPIAQTYYFEAFTPISNGYIWESITHPDYDLIKGIMVTSLIIVK